MGKTAKSGQPKSKAKEEKKTRAPKEIKIPETTMEKFDFLALARSMATEIKDCGQQGVRESKLVWASGCDGLNTIAGVLTALKIPNHQLYGSEKASAPAVFSLKRFQPGHLYQDIRASSEADGGVICLRHGRRCRLPVDEEPALFAAGFSCKNNSILNPARFGSSPLRPECESAITFDGAVLSIAHVRPRFFVLENVNGARRSSSKHVFMILRVMPTGAGASASDSKKSPLDSYLEKLGTRLPEYSVTAVMADAAPLPERRERVFILGSRTTDLDATAWAAAVECLQRFSAGKPKHHVQTLLSLGDPAARDGAQAAANRPLKWMSEYSSCLSTALATLSDKGGMTDVTEETVKAAGKRISDLYPDVLKTTPRIAATADGNEILIDSMCKAAEAQGAPPSVPKLADLSQSVGRGSVWIHGTIGTLTTSTNYFSYDHGRFVDPEDHLRILGWDEESIKLASECLSKAELQEAAGNGMSWAAVLKVLLPMLMRMGFLSDLLK
ncbi:unnamed protein product [Symbiodinium sp. CCMP2592]|nr:unnamed protein product [Symbiodinium sp. CCMP2592]